MLGRLGRRVGCEIDAETIGAACFTPTSRIAAGGVRIFGLRHDGEQRGPLGYRRLLGIRRPSISLRLKGAIHSCAHERARAHDQVWA